jgi:hypothetical protein
MSFCWLLARMTVPKSRFTLQKVHCAVV